MWLQAVSIHHMHALGIECTIAKEVFTFTGEIALANKRYNAHV